MRLTDAQAQKLLTNGGDRFIDPDIKRKYNIKTCTKGDTIYTYTPEYDKAGREIKKNKKEFATVLSCSTFYQSKGVGYFDNEFKGEYYIVLDEMNREQNEKNCFDIVYNFVNLLENVARSTKNNIKVILIGNTLSEASDILAAFNFIPNEFGRYKLKSKRLVVDYIRPNKNYLDRRKGTMADILMPNASTFTNEVDIDTSLMVSNRECKRPTKIIKFGKETDKWYTLWDEKIIKQYNNEKVRDLAMVKYIDAVFNPEAQEMVFEMFNNRYFRFTNVAVFKRF